MRRTGSSRTISLTFDNSGRLWRFRPTHSRHGAQPVDARLTGTAIAITVTVPGLESGDVDLHATDNVLQIRGRADRTIDLACDVGPAAQGRPGRARDRLRRRRASRSASRSWPPRPRAPSSPSRWPSDDDRLDTRPPPRRTRTRGAGSLPWTPRLSAPRFYVRRPPRALLGDRPPAGAVTGPTASVSLLEYLSLTRRDSGAHVPHERPRPVAIEAKHLRPRLDHVSLRPEARELSPQPSSVASRWCALRPATARPRLPPPCWTSADARRRGTSSTSSITTRSPFWRRWRAPYSAFCGFRRRLPARLGPSRSPTCRPGARTSSLAG